MFRFHIGDKVRIKTTGVFRGPSSWWRTIDDSWVVVDLNDKKNNRFEIVALSYEMFADSDDITDYYTIKQEQPPQTLFTVLEKDIELIPEESGPIVIYRDKKDPSKIVAKNQGTGETACAKCSPKDAFDFEAGARIAFDRLVKSTEDTKEDSKSTKSATEDPSYYNGLFYVSNSGLSTYFKAGTIWRVVNGVIEGDKQCLTRYGEKRFKDFSEVEAYLRKKLYLSICEVKG